MITDGEKLLLQETLKIAKKGILTIENVLPTVENEELKNNLNCHLNRLHQVADKSEEELIRESFERELSEWTKSDEVLIKVTNYYSDHELANVIIHECMGSVHNISEALASQELRTKHSYKLATDMISDDSDYINILKAYL